ncbi:hypothetical protein MSPP1_001264 [Malassezia sp. CBS 17886]|nr:hypothetical protein MSPP1_001264 [Malassezia sp. CBS 17886]
MSAQPNTNVPHLPSMDAKERTNIRSHVTVGPFSSKEVSKSAALTSNQPAVVAPELAGAEEAPIPQIGQDAVTGPEMVGAEDPTNDNVPKKTSFFDKLVKGIKHDL